MPALKLYTEDTETSRTDETTLAKVFRDAVRPRLELGRRADSTVDEYERSVRLWTTIVGDLELADITDESLDRFTSALVAKGLAARTVNKHSGYLQTLLNHCGTSRRTRSQSGCLGRPLGVLDRVPEFQRLEEDEPESRSVPTAVEVAAMIDQSGVAELPRRQPGLKWQTLLQLLTWCGARRNDAFATLQAQHWIRDERCPLANIDVRWPHGWLCWTIGKTRRTKKRPHVVPLSPEIAAGLAQITRTSDPEAPLLGFRVNSAVQWYRDLHRIQRAAGMTEMIGFHGLRKRCNIDWDLECGLGTGELFLGHSAKTVNRKCYSETSALMVRAAERRLGNR